VRCYIAFDFAELRKIIGDCFQSLLNFNLLERCVSANAYN
jgi:hypothetical protein